MTQNVFLMDIQKSSDNSVFLIAGGRPSFRPSFCWCYLKMTDKQLRKLKMIMTINFL